MRYPEGHKEEVRERIVKGAARALRKKGLDGLSVPAAMKLANLTHGAFYVHFRNRDELVADAIERAADETSARLAERRSLEELLATYLSPEHLAHPEHGCVLAAIGCEGLRAKGRVRSAFGRAARTLVHTVERAICGTRRGAEKDRALFVAAAMIGAVVLARLVDDPVVARRVLDAARDALVQTAENAKG